MGCILVNFSILRIQNEIYIHNHLTLAVLQFITDDKTREIYTISNRYYHGIS